MPTLAPTSPTLHIPRSGIRTLMELANRDPEALHLEIGEPDATTAPHVVDAAARAAHDGLAGYTASTGIPALRAAAAERVTRVSGRKTAADDVVVTHGAMHGLTMTMAALLGPGDEVLLPDPMFPNWAMAAVSVGATVGTYRTAPEAGYVPDPADVEAAIGPRTRAVVVCSPNNPTGAVYPAEVVAALVDVARRHDLWVLSDECYEAVTFGAPHVSPAAFDTDGRVVVQHSLSKTYAMTGWRLGYLATPRHDVVETLGHLAEATVACPSAVGQHAALAALTGSQDYVALAVASYRARRDAAVAQLDAAGIGYVRPEGAFYLMVDVGVADTDAFALRLLAERHVAVAPGATFGAAAHGRVRVSLAAAPDVLRTGLARLVEAVEEVRAGDGAAADRRAQAEPLLAAN
ncbi:pyridoxal phosphate-dependent aminotransferase [Cellulomonas fimi]|uniref:Aminotransferase n=1 Tax=Cellulomonas fimi (strain ATCC 484 / DSM 20113 / JCM 1341 / CCUG 24087 / LMG 16345 / NBRC 15513 / NCIMB 8980 / NCTC 7547 / NRS-133) TaxID=590998 RepID=F4H0B7_CELFA|nr:aminotransferase class I/II-fold pyridoxal phosphate-dependent enzyme [Cellulomonas fimi]AEE46164.1 aminotransferase class I and II [Cellulomonas fimi ATCC 484]NNH07049.1 aminotransferase class I/II-fold pyridoxal phosphate-dependent enzyme [Cellulomonas fimi]VEH31890.1 Aspartate aminotransferase [Cellulomonas fimi]